MIYILLIAIGLAIDAFSVSIVLGGVNNKKVLNRGIISSTMFGLFQSAMSVIGWIIGETFKSFISGIDHWIAFILLFAIGVKMIYGNLYDKKDLLIQENISFKFIISLAFATSIDALIIGIGLAFIGVPILLTIIVIGIITFLLSMIGIYLGIKSKGFLHNRTGIVGGFILIVIGIKILIDHIFI